MALDALPDGRRPVCPASDPTFAQVVPCHGMSSSERRIGSVIALLVTAIVSGAAAALVTACFLWSVTESVKLLWSTLPRHVGVDPHASWWLFAVPAVGGVFVGLGQRFLGDYPVPIEEALAMWKAGDQMAEAATPKTFVNSFFSLAFGGPVGFEAALTGIIGGMATWISRNTHAAGRYVRQAWGAERIEALPEALAHLPYWLAATAGLFAFHWMPFGGIDLGFRFTKSSNVIGITSGLAAFGFAAAVVVPTVWMVSVISRAERASLSKRSPELAAVAGALVFALLAVPNSLVLFSGQQGIQQLPGTGNGTLAYIMVAKWLALVVALVAGWRGGPIFPTFTAVAACGVLVASLTGADPQLLMIAGIAAVSVVFTKGRVVLAFVLTLYPVPLGFAALILVGCIGAASALALARPLGMLPTSTDEGSPSAAPSPSQ